MIDKIEAERLDADLVIAHALAAIGRWDDAAARLAPEAEAAGWVHAARCLARAQVLAAHPDHPKRVVDDLEAALDFFQKTGLPKPFLEGLGLAVALHLLRRDDTVALDRAERLARSADRLNDPDAAVAARLHAGLAYELRGDLAFADRVLTTAVTEAAPGSPKRALATARRARVAARRGHARTALQLIATLTDADAAHGIEITAVLATSSVELARLASAAEAMLPRDAAMGPVLADVACRLGPSAVATAAPALRAAGHVDLAALITGDDTAAPAWIVDVHAVAAGEALVAAGRLADAANLVDDAAPRLRERGFDGHAALASLLAARCYRLGGANDVARQRLLAAIGIYDPTIEALVALEAATQAAARGEFDTALTLATPLANAEPRIAATAAVLRAEASMALGRPAEARQALGAQIPTSPALRARALAVALAVTEALGEDTAAAAAALREAVAAVVGLPREQAHLAFLTPTHHPEG